jgi:hypothetical protein
MLHPTTGRNVGDELYQIAKAALGNDWPEDCEEQQKLLLAVAYSLNEQHLRRLRSAQAKAQNEYTAQCYREHGGYALNNYAAGRTDYGPVSYAEMQRMQERYRTMNDGKLPYGEKRTCTQCGITLTVVAPTQGQLDKAFTTCLCGGKLEAAKD